MREGRSKICFQTIMKSNEQEPNIRWERIKEIAGKYGSELPIAEKVILLQFVQEDIRSHRENLAKQLATIDELLGNESPHGRTSMMAPKAPRKKRARREGSTPTTAEAIVQAMEAGKEMKIPAIVEAVTELKGKVSKPSINQALMKLVKEKKIKNVERGVYAKA